ncbi:MAG: DUF6665 family protein [Sporichthyaceae bacterium]
MRDPHRHRWQAYEAVLDEVAQERASALGLAGRRLEEAVARYRALVEDDAAGDQQLAEAFAQTRDAAWALMVQRECAGFRSRDLGWLRDLWQVPDEVLRQI